jgi:UDPglucose--hexose-1-phosphate uridylyltransferase
MISSQKDLGQIDTLSDNSIENLSHLLMEVIEKLKQQLGCFDFNLSIITQPLQDAVFEACRFAIRIIPRIYKEGGFELSTGVYINPVAPEQAARLLRGSENE